jgi:NAD(P)-dependent dehydrogenase (short-subunit alcohol dehydrogenase family)
MTLHIPAGYAAPRDLLKDRAIIVTGAGQGLGRMAALAFAAHGATVMLSGRSAAKLEATYDLITTAGGPEPAMLPFDLSSASASDYEGFAHSVHAALGRVDGIMHCAAHFVPLAPLAVQTLDQWLALLRVNLAAPFALTRACLPLLKRAADASIILVGETHGIHPRAYWGGFAVSKAGLGALTAIWSQELSQTAVRINCLVPGPVASPQRFLSHPGELAASLPSLDSLAPASLFLMGPDSREMTGQIIEIRPPQAG